MDAFAEDSSDDDEVIDAYTEVANRLAIHFRKKESSLVIQWRILLLLNKNYNEDKWKNALKQKQITEISTSLEDGPFDACIWDTDDGDALLERLCSSCLVPGGQLVTTRNLPSAAPAHHLSEETTTIIEDWKLYSLFKIQIATETCPWLNSDHDSIREQKLAQQATIDISAQERNTRLSAHSITRAVTCLTDFGYCIVPGLLVSQRDTILEFGQAILSDVHTAAEILRNNFGIDIYDPTNSTFEPESYRELSMREDFRLDLRDGPTLRRLRGNNAAAANQPRRVGQQQQHDQDCSSCCKDNDFLRGHADILEIVQRTMNPTCSKPTISHGNYGRFNFDGGGPNGTFQDLNMGVVGGIVSLPGAADQAIHADTPHLFEIHPHLPPHYINVFTPGYCPYTEHVGQTAFVHGSHRLDVCAQHVDTNTFELDANVWYFLVRPKLNLGDVVFFDCRILHFGLANHAAAAIERPMIYANFTMHWFHDPKNWDQHQCIFPKQDENDNK